MLYSIPDLGPEEAAVLARIEDLHGALNYAVSQPTRWRGILRRTALARAIRGSNTIEGYTVGVDDAVAAVEQDEPFEADPHAEVWMATLGYRNAMTYVQRLRSDPHFRLDASLLRALHYMILWYDLGKNPGSWRPGYIAVRNDALRKIVYEGPDASDVPALVDELLDELSRDSSSPLIRAALVHLNLAKIHPFSDGNGRMARCLQSLILTRETALAEPYSSIEEFLGDPRNTSEYYAVLAEMDRGRWEPTNSTGAWIRFVLKAHFMQAATTLRRQATIAKLWSEVEHEVEQRKLPERATAAMVNAALGFRMRNSTYRHDADVTEDVAGRDLRVLVSAGMLEAVGEKRGRTYIAADFLRRLGSRVSASLERPIIDPFEKPEDG